MIKITDIKENKNNPRFIKDEKFDKLKQSIKDFPKMLELRPIIVDEDNIILGGNMRFKALKDLGYKELQDNWVKRASELSEDEKKQFIIKDNVGFGAWDYDMLANEWEVEELEDWGLDLPVDFTDPEILEAEEDDYEVPEGGIETDIVLGDLFEIGKHRLLCGDSFNSDDCSKLMSSNKANIVFTDPPYDLEKEDYSENILLFTKDAHVFVMHDDKVIVNYLRQSSLEFKRFFIANFQFSSPRGNDPYLQHIIVSHEVNGKAIVHKNLHDGFASIIKLEYRFRNKEEDYGHKHQKPVNFISKFIIHYSNENDICLDLFGGSGSTMATCEQLNRKCYTMELDPKNCQLIINRMTKLDPSLIIKRNGEIYNGIR